MVVNFSFAASPQSIDPSQQFTWEHSNLEVNKPKNRYANVIAYDHTRVILAPIEGELDEKHRADGEMKTLSRGRGLVGWSADGLNLKFQTPPQTGRVQRRETDKQRGCIRVQPALSANKRDGAGRENRFDRELMNSPRHAPVCLLSHASPPAAVCRRQQLPATAHFVRPFDVIHGG